MKLTGISRSYVLAFGVAALACLSNGTLAYEPAFQWVRQLGGTGREYGTEVAVDSEGRTHVVGDFSSTNLVIGNTILTNGGLFIARYDLAGNAIWARQIHTTFDRLWRGSSFDYRIAADDLGNTFINVWFARPNQPGSITFEGVTLTNSTTEDSDLILAKYDASGNLAWARSAGTDGTKNILRTLDVAADSTGNCYVTGGYLDAPSIGLTNVSNDVGAFVAKFGGGGDLIWSRSLTSSNVLARDQFLALDNSGGYFMAGYFVGPSITFGNITLTNRGVFVVRYDSTGSPLWAKNISGIDNGFIYVGINGFGVDAAGNSYVHLYAENTISFDNLVITNGGFCFAKYGPAGNVLWCRSSSTADASVLRSTTDAAGNSYVLGTFYDSATFDGITLTNHNNPEYPNFAHPDNFLTKFDSDGRVLWAKQFGGTDILADHTRKGSVAVDAAGNCSVTGFIFVPDSTFDGFVLSPVSEEEEDFFVARLDADPPRLDITHSGNVAVLSWPTNQPGFSLETSTNLLSNEAWSLVQNPVTTAGTRYFVTNSVSANNRFFRLRK